MSDFQDRETSFRNREFFGLWKLFAPASYTKQIFGDWEIYERNC